MRAVMGGIVVCLSLTALLGAQSTLSVSSESAFPGQTVSLSISVDTPSPSRIAALQWTLQYPASNFTSVGFVSGPAAAAAGKFVRCDAAPGTLVCVAAGLNFNTVAPGVVAAINLTLASPGAGAVSDIRLSDVLASDADAGRLPITGAGGMVTAVEPSFSVGCGRTTVTAGGALDCAVRFAAPVPKSTIVSLWPSGAVVEMPASVAIAAGASAAEFRLATQVTDADQSLAITAAFLGMVRETSVAVTGLRPVSLACTPQAFVGPGRTRCEARLNAATPAGFEMLLASASQSVAVPALGTVRAGQIGLVFDAEAQGVDEARTARLSARIGQSAATVDVTVLPSDVPQITAPGQVLARAGTPVRFTVTAAARGGVAVQLGASGLPPGASFDSSTGAFEWSPQLPHIGAYGVVFTATTAANVTASRTVAILVGSGKPIIRAIVDAASFSSEAACSAGGLASLFGTDLTQGETAQASATPLPAELAGLRIKANDAFLPLLYVSPTQINFQCPDASSGERANISVLSGGDASEVAQLPMLYASPGIFTAGGSQGAILIAGTAKIAAVRTASIPSQPAQPGDYLSIFAQGLGPADPALPLGQAAPAEPLSKAMAPIRVTIGGVDAEVSFAGLAPGYVGLYQVNVRIPASVPVGDSVPAQIIVTEPGGRLRTSNTVGVAIEASTI